MVVKDFRDLLDKRPFEPFRVVMSSGDRHEIRHPEMGWLTRSTLYVGVGGDADAPDRAVMCSLLHITNIEPADQPLPAVADANGSAS